MTLFEIIEICVYKNKILMRKKWFNLFVLMCVVTGECKCRRDKSAVGIS